MSMGIRDLNIKLSYVGKGETILKEFLLPTICNSVSYDRVTSFYTIESLLAIAQGIQSLYEKNGKMRLIIGVHSFPAELVDAVLRQEHLHKEIEKVRHEIQSGIRSLSSSLEKERLATIAWMIQDKLLEVKVASVEGKGIFHPKTLILTDENGDKIVAVGSPNETPYGLGSNIEQVMVAKSWESLEAAEVQQQFFDSLWSGEADYVAVDDVSEDTAAMILEALGEQYSTPPKKDTVLCKHIIEASSKMPANFFVSGDIPALYMHQERAVLDALSRWPVRVLFSDEVGLGKTFEVAATMTFLIKYCGVKKVVILTPKSVLQQWQDELYEHFGINAWLYDSGTRAYIDTEKNIISVEKKNPLGAIAPDIILMSAQYARGMKGSKTLFDREDTIMPDLLVVDEAHSARVSQSLSGERQKTRMYSMLEKVARKVPHLILATATPMQKDADEYHAILKLLGLPKAWQKSRNYQTSLRLIASNDVPDTSDAYNAGSLLLKTISSMAPSRKRLTKAEAHVVDGLVKASEEAADQYEIGRFVQDNWAAFHTTFIKLHPAHLLTVRNTRRSLAQVGYKFPKRNLIEESVEDSILIQFFYDKVYKFLSEQCFSIEQTLYPDRKISVGFVRVSYQQRVASSLFSCKQSLSRRAEKVNQLKKWLDGLTSTNITTCEGFDLASALDDLELDEMLENGQDEFDIDITNVDLAALKRTVGIESTALNSLLHEANSLLASSGDMKIKCSIELARECVAKGDAVLLFSRYTDTIDALLDEFKRVGADNENVYGIYTGKTATIIDSGNAEACDKSTIKAELFSGRLKVMFCSDAASEGLNLQAARVLINVDVPWTPARLEQRIGRVARLGQVADEVDIYNVWYPYSIEARMYHRIQKRLDETMLAIGEFPEVVAANIKQAVLDNSIDDNTGLAQLKEIRNSYQVSALEELWSTTDDHLTTSHLIRDRLLAILSQELPVVGSSLGGRIISYRLPDDTVVGLTSDDGMAEAVSLQSAPWKQLDFVEKNIRVKLDKEKRYAAFCSANGKMLKHEAVLKFPLGEVLTTSDDLKSYPKMLPDNSRLHLEYAIDCTLPPRPHLWIK